LFLTLAALQLVLLAAPTHAQSVTALACDLFFITGARDGSTTRSFIVDAAAPTGGSALRFALS
jgi:hypothetical protein